LRQPVQEHRVAGLAFRIIRCRGVQYDDAPHPLGLLRTRRQRPSNSRRAAEQSDELASPHGLPQAEGHILLNC